MVKGLDRFREYFAGHEDGYALIGGAAGDILFGEAGLPFRATNDFGWASTPFASIGSGRLCFEWPDGQAGPDNVEIVDYHG